MTRKRPTAGRRGLPRRFAGRRAEGMRGPRVPVTVVVPLIVMVAVAAVVLPAVHHSGGSKLGLAAARSLWRHRPAPLPMPPAGPPPGVNCTLTVPASPLSAQGLATPYELSGQDCSQATTVTRAFVQATIFDPATGSLSVYEPLVVTQGTQPAAAPVVPTLPQGAVVTLDFGFNGDHLSLAQASGSNALWQGRCVNGLRGSIFGQAAYCNARAFFHAVNRAVAAGTVKIPAAGTASDGQPCPTVRSFTMVDQDPSDNVTTRYLLTGSGQTAQDSAANAAQLTGTSVVTNGSDHALLDNFIDPSLGCSPFTAPDLSNGGASGTSQALDELMAAADQQAPVAYVPVNDPMTEVNGHFSMTKTDLYRAGVDQPRLRRWTRPSRNAQAYCHSMVTVQASSLQTDQATFAAAPPADPEVGSNLFTFLAARLSGSFANLGCGNFGMTNPVNLTTDGNGVAVAATFGTASPSPSPSPSASASP